MDKRRRKHEDEGLVIYNIIKESRLKNSEIAEKLDVSERLIGYYKSGERRMDIIKFIKLLQITKTNIQELEVH